LCTSQQVDIVLSGHVHSDAVLNKNQYYYYYGSPKEVFKMPTDDTVYVVTDSFQGVEGQYAYRSINVYSSGALKILQSSKFTSVSSASCFLPGTKITMADGTIKEIQNLKVGDYVRSWYKSIGKDLPARVTKVYTHTPTEMTDYYLIINKKLRVTPNHPIYINGKWTVAGDAEIGNYQLGSNGKLNLVTSVDKVIQKVTTYDIEIETPEVIQIQYQQINGQRIYAYSFYADGILVGSKTIFNQQEINNYNNLMELME